jgi:hypothetical protein
MTTLIYKRTHPGDPNAQGVFGCHDCMGRVRAWDFDAVIGVGGKRPDSGHEDLARRITWVGINARKTKARGLRGPLVGFARFCLWEEQGPHIRHIAPNLFRYMFVQRHVCAVLSNSLPARMQEEIQDILALAQDHRATLNKRGTAARRTPGAKQRKPFRKRKNPKPCKSSC